VSGRPAYTATLIALIAAAMCYALQQTMVVPALPQLQHDLHTTPAWVTWVFGGFLLSASVCTPLLGKLGDQYGKERLLLVSLGIFLVGSIGAAAAWNIWSLIAFRVLQGGAGGIFPLSFSIVRDEFPREKIGMAIGTISAVFGIGGSVGLVLSGLIVDNLSWRWIFIIGAIPIALCLPLVHRFVPESPIKTRTRVDVKGALLLSIGLTSLLLAITEGPGHGWTSPLVAGLFLASIVVLITFGTVEMRVQDPMIAMTTLRRRPVLFTNITALISGFAMYSTFILVPQFTETPRQYAHEFAHLVNYGFAATATHAGLYLVPGSLTMLVAGPVAGLIGRRVGSKWPLAFGMAAIAGGSIMLARANAHPWEIIVAMLILSPGVSFAFAALATLITEEVDATETGVANAVTVVLRTIGGVIGAQVGASIIAAHTIAGTPVPAHSGYVIAFTLFAAFALFGAGIALFVTPRRGRVRVAARATGD
jgi:EmrB/QacA subfamily drug resistance transporter